MQQVDQDPGVGLVRRPQHPGGLAEVRRLGPRRELQVDGEAERPGQLAQLGEPVDLAREVRVGQLRDDVAGAEFGTRLQEALEVARVFAGLIRASSMSSTSMPVAARRTFVVRIRAGSVASG